MTICLRNISPRASSLHCEFTFLLHISSIAIIVLTICKQSRMFRPNSIEIESDYDAAPVPTTTNRPSTCQYMYVRLDRISAALIDSSRIMELVSFSARETDVRFSVTTAKTRLAVAIGDVQLDQQNYGMNTKVPVILSPTQVKYPQPTLQFLAWKDNIRSTCDVDSYEYVALQVKSIDTFFYSPFTIIFAMLSLIDVLLRLF